LSISAFLKVIHAPKPLKTPQKRVESGALSLQSGLPMDLINTPISRVSCPNDENPENQADEFGAFLPKRGLNQVP
jgi:hypothetical protein